MNKSINLQYTTITSPVPNFVYEGLQEYSRDANTYRPQPQFLIEKLALKHTISNKNIFLTAGADEAINILALAYGKSTYIFTPTYVVYEDITQLYAHVTKIDSLKDNNYIIDTSTKPDATLFYLANPNSPFGFSSREKIIELIENNPQAIIIIDEVYAEFSNLSVISLVSKYKNLVVIRSFSKAYAMAGNRIGFLVGYEDIINKVKTKTQWSNVSYLSVGAAIAALDHEEYFEKLLSNINNRREKFMQFLNEKKFTVLPSKINAVLLRLNDESEGIKFVEHLKMHNIIVSHGNGASNIGLDKSFVRIAIGTDEEMEEVKRVISLLQS